MAKKAGDRKRFPRRKSVLLLHVQPPRGPGAHFTKTDHTPGDLVLQKGWQFVIAGTSKTVVRVNGASYDEDTAVTTYFLESSGTIDERLLIKAGWKKI